MADERVNLVLSGVVLDEEMTLSLAELCRASCVCAEEVIAMVEEGLLEPGGTSPADWYFPADSLLRLRAALRLQRDLQINLAGVALAMDLLDELRVLRERLRQLERRGLPP
jgi:chaperone modulatory protein CbpM